MTESNQATNPETRTLCESSVLKDEFGTIRVAEWPEGLVLWVGGEIRWRSWRDPKLWNARKDRI